jgi:hypothetical protein
MITLTDNPSVITHNHSPHHWVGLRIPLPVLSQLDASPHIILVVSHIIRAAKIQIFSEKTYVFYHLFIIADNENYLQKHSTLSLN